MKKTFISCLLLIIILTIALGLILKIFLPDILKNQFITNGKLLSGTDVYISSVDIRLDGSLNIKDIRIKNPSDFSKNNFLELENLFIKIRPETLFKEVIYVENVNLKNANILVELNDKAQINITELSKQINTPKEKPPEKTNNSKFEKKFIIENLSIISPTLLLSSKELNIRKNYELPDIQIVDVGVKENGVRPEEIVTGFLARISGESENYTLGLTKNLNDYFSKKKQKLIDDIRKEEKKLKGIANDVKIRLKRFGIE
ncbi:MAG: hypothetical protein EVA26_05055 [Burkholderiaceae bacterium]|nr:MAG: hypothetical protein EVA26_05055 [Burkholderiaceae bacterium]